MELRARGHVKGVWLQVWLSSAVRLWGESSGYPGLWLCICISLIVPVAVAVADLVIVA